MGVASFLAVLVLVLQSSESLQIKGPESNIFLGDFNQFSCQKDSGDDFKDMSWTFILKDGVRMDVNASDMIPDSKAQTKEDGMSELQNYIRINSADVIGVECREKLLDGSVSEQKVSTQLQDFIAINSFIEPFCENGPKILLKRWDEGFKSQYWVSHYVTNKIVPLEGDSVSGLKLTCLSRQQVKWFTTQNLSSFQYWTRQPKTEHGCHSAVLIMNPLTSLSSQKFICGENKDEKDTWVELAVQGLRFQNELEFNKTQECIEHLGTTVFGNSALTWATTGTSLMSVGMMVGIVFLKKQLDKQKETSNQQSSTPASV